VTTPKDIERRIETLEKRREQGSRGVEFIEVWCDGKHRETIEVTRPGKPRRPEGTR